MKNIYIKIYKDGRVKISLKSYVNQPNQGHQPWQSNSLGTGGKASSWDRGMSDDRGKSGKGSTSKGFDMSKGKATKGKPFKGGKDYEKGSKGGGGKASDDHDRSGKGDNGKSGGRTRGGASRARGSADCLIAKVDGPG